MLFIVNKKGDALADCIERACAEDVVLLIEDAVYAAVMTKTGLTLSGIANDVVIYALTPDMQARGLDVERCFEQVQYVDYVGFVELVVRNNPVRSCF